MTDTAQPMSRRRAFLWLALWALGIGVVCLALGWWLWKPLRDLGWLGVILGAAWLVCVPLASDEPMTRAYRRYLRAFLPAMGGYVLAIFVLGFVRHAGLPAWALAALALLPVVPMVWVVLTMWRFARDSDELERRIQLEAVFVTCAVAGLAAFAVGMLQMVGLVRFDAGLFFVLPGMFLVYGVASWWCRRRYGMRGMG